MNKVIYFIIGLGILLFIGYKYFNLDENEPFQQSLKDKDINAAEVAVRDAVSTQLQAQAKGFFYEHNNYFVSKSDNLCTALQANFDTFKKIINNPVECSAEVHSFTARIKSGSKYYCSDTSGFHTTSLVEPGYIAGVRCK
jgi:transposase